MYTDYSETIVHNYILFNVGISNSTIPPSFFFFFFLSFRHIILGVVKITSK